MKKNYSTWITRQICLNTKQWVRISWAMINQIWIIWIISNQTRSCQNSIKIKIKIKININLININLIKVNSINKSKRTSIKYHSTTIRFTMWQTRLICQRRVRDSKLIFLIEKEKSKKKVNSHSKRSTTQSKFSHLFYQSTKHWKMRKKSCLKNSRLQQQSMSSYNSWSIKSSEHELISN